MYNTIITQFQLTMSQSGIIQPMVRLLLSVPVYRRYKKMYNTIITQSQLTRVKYGSNFKQGL
jgi:hypothetical protein